MKNSDLENKIKELEQELHNIKSNSAASITPTKPHSTVSEEKFKEMINFLPQIVYEVDINGNLTYVNKHAFASFGYSKEDFDKGFNIQKIFIPQDKNRLNENMQNILQGKDVENHEYFVLRKDGSTFPVLTYSSAILKDDKPVGWRGICVDITEHKKTEESLRLEKENFRNSLDDSPLGVRIVTTEGDTIYANKTILNIYGYDSLEELQKISLKNRYTPESYTEAIERKQQRKQGNLIDNDYEISIVRKNGEIRNLHVYRKKVLWNGVRQFQVLYNDITERKKAEDELLESEEKFRLMIKNSSDMIVLINESGEQVFVSDAIQRVTGYSPEETKGLFSNFIHPDDLDNLVQRWNEVLTKTNTIVNAQYRHKHKENRYIWLEAVAQNFLDHACIKAVIVNIRDISRNKKSEFLLMENKEKLLQLNADKDRFISILGHDLKSPFNSLLGFSELLAKNIRKYDIDEIEKFAANINKSAQSTHDLLNELLYWAQAQQGNIGFEPQNLRFTDVCSDVLVTINPTANTKNIKVNCLAEDDCYVYADNGMLKTVLRNLVSNAIKFTNNGGSVDIKAEQHPENITIGVSDNGVGMPPENLKKLFDISEFQTTKGTSGETGTGLGLLLCKEFVEKHGGRIWAESQEGKGSEFRFTLPKK